MISTEFLVTSLIVVLMPGTGVVFTVSAGIFRGWRAGIYAAIGCTAGILPHLLASLLGLAAVLHMSALAFQTLKYAGAAYLLYLAWTMWRETGPLVLQRPDAHGAAKLAIRAFVVNILNPKLSIFFLAFLPQFVAPDVGSPLAQMVLLSAVFMVMTFVVFVAYGLLAHGVRVSVIESPRLRRWLQRTFAAIFAGLGLKLALSER